MRVRVGGSGGLDQRRDVIRTGVRCGRVHRACKAELGALGFIREIQRKLGRSRGGNRPALPLVRPPLHRSPAKRERPTRSAGCRTNARWHSLQWAPAAARGRESGRLANALLSGAHADGVAVLVPSALRAPRLAFCERIRLWHWQALQQLSVQRRQKGLLATIHQPAASRARRAPLPAGRTARAMEL